MNDLYAEAATPAEGTPARGSRSTAEQQFVDEFTADYGREPTRLELDEWATQRKRRQGQQ
jgi:hypothetical protein